MPHVIVVSRAKAARHARHPERRLSYQGWSIIMFCIFIITGWRGGWLCFFPASLVSSSKVSCSGVSPEILEFGAASLSHEIIFCCPQVRWAITTGPRSHWCSSTASSSPPRLPSCICGRCLTMQGVSGGAENWSQKQCYPDKMLNFIYKKCMVVVILKFVVPDHRKK